MCSLFAWQLKLLFLLPPTVSVLLSGTGAEISTLPPPPRSPSAWASPFRAPGPGFQGLGKEVHSHCVLAGSPSCPGSPPSGPAGTTRTSAQPPLASPARKLGPSLVWPTQLQAPGQALRQLSSRLSLFSPPRFNKRVCLEALNPVALPGGHLPSETPSPPRPAGT